ncbi:MAG: hypothetical protein JXA37_03565 [Chloroflexia bacterium]|nr:hypothetical protein [Chloroflexia bacterium]
MSDELYFYDSLTGETLFLSGGVDGFHVAPGGWQPGTCGLDGGTSTVALATYEEDGVVEDQDDMEERFSTLALWIERAVARYDQRIGLIYLCYRPDGRTFTRRAAVTNGSARKVGWKSAARGSIYYFESEATIDHEAPELDGTFELRNMVSNPSFEYDVNGNGIADGWTLSGSGSGSLSTDPQHGRYCQLLSPVSAGDYLMCTNFAVSAGQAYEFSFEGWADGPNGITISVRNAATHLELASATGAYGGAGWCRVRGTVTIPGGVTNVYIRLVANSSGSIKLDKVCFGPQHTYGGADCDTGMWSDYFVLYSHDDWEWDNASGTLEGPGADQNSAHREHLDLLEPIGDLSPALQVHLYQSSGEEIRPRIGLLSSPYADQTWLSFQAESLGVHNAPVLSTDAGASGPASNNCYKLPLTATGQPFLDLFIDEDQALRLAGHQVRLYALLGSDIAAGADYTVQWGISPAETEAPAVYYRADLEYDAGARLWALYGGPTIKFPLQPSGIPPDRGIAETTLYLWAKQADGKDVYVDRIVLAPVDAWMDARSYTMSSATRYLVVDGPSGRAHEAVTSGGDVDKLDRSALDVEGRLEGYALERMLRLWINCWPEAPRSGSPERAVQVRVVYRPRYHTL